MIKNNNLSSNTNNSYYSKNFEAYRNIKLKNNKIPLHRFYSADKWEETIPLLCLL